MRWLLILIALIISSQGLFISRLSAVSPVESLSQINGLKLRLVPTYPDPISGLGVKTVEVSQEGPDILVKWFSPARIQTGNAPWPEYRIDLKRGGVSTNGINDAEALAHPHLWIEGVIRLDRNGLLWVPSNIIQSDGTQTFQLEPGFLGTSFSLFSKGPPGLVAKIEEFRNTIGNDPNNLYGSFLAEVSEVRLLEKGKHHPLAINGKKTDVATVIIGNKYIRYTVLQSIENPLVLAVTFYPANVPKGLRSYFDFFHQYLEYQITQVFTGE